MFYCDFAFLFKSHSNNLAHGILNASSLGGILDGSLDGTTDILRGTV